MTSKVPPVPPAARNPKQHEVAREPDRDAGRKPAPSSQEQGRSGNIHENTTNQGYQQDR